MIKHICGIDESWTVEDMLYSIGQAHGWGLAYEPGLGHVVRDEDGEIVAASDSWYDAIVQASELYPPARILPRGATDNEQVT